MLALVFHHVCTQLTTMNPSMGAEGQGLLQEARMAAIQFENV